MLHWNLFSISQAFEKFATLLVEKKIKADPHIEPLWSRCGLCYLDIDVIGKMETFEMDSNYLVTKGQLISKCLLGVIVLTKKPTNLFQDFYPNL